MQTLIREDLPQPDLVALDQNKQVVLVAEVKAFPSAFSNANIRNAGIAQLLKFLSKISYIVPYIMLADTNNIFIYRWDGKSVSEPILNLKTVDVLSYYEPEFNQKQIFSLYLYQFYTKLHRTTQALSLGLIGTKPALSRLIMCIFI
jgi:hypothetical protein